MALEANRQQSADETEACCGAGSGFGGGSGSDGGSSRRALLRAAGASGAVVAVAMTTAACGGAWDLNSTVAEQTPLSSRMSSDDALSPTATPDGTLVAVTDEIPVDGGKIIPDSGGTVITQPSAGVYKAFTATCTHQGCTVGAVANNQITCPCHGSVFSAQDGTVIQGPAVRPLAAKPIAVFADRIYLTNSPAVGSPSADSGN
jgi:Rieske Fe-S protein